MKRILILLLILTLSIMFTACGSSDDEKQGEEEVTTNEEVNEDIEEETEEEEEIEEKEIIVVEGGEYTDRSKGAITVTVPDGYIASEDTAYSSEETLATITVRPQDAGVELLNTFLMVQIIAAEGGESSAREYLETYASKKDLVAEVEVAGLNGFSFKSDGSSGWTNEYYALVGPKTPDGGFDYIVIIWGLGLDASYIDDVHGMITSLDFNFSRL
jgi:major membrane immunogen (membrane-anchored lipoprotein)